jgi:putative flippase GtrA
MAVAAAGWRPGCSLLRGRGRQVKLRPVLRIGRWAGRGSLLRNSVAGGVATGADFMVVAAIVSLEWAVVPVATLWGCALGAAVNFGMNRVWAFGSDLGVLRQVGRYLGVSAASAVLNAALVALLLVSWSGSYAVAWGIARVVVFLGWNYPLHRRYVFSLRLRAHPRLPHTRCERLVRKAETGRYAAAGGNANRPAWPRTPRTAAANDASRFTDLADKSQSS